MHVSLQNNSNFHNFLIRPLPTELLICTCKYILVLQKVGFLIPEPIPVPQNVIECKLYVWCFAIRYAHYSPIFWANVKYQSKRSSGINLWTMPQTIQRIIILDLINIFTKLLPQSHHPVVNELNKNRSTCHEGSSVAHLSYTVKHLVYEAPNPKT